MLTRTLGKSKLEVSALGMGCWAIGGPWTWDQPGQTPYPVGWGNTDDAESIRALTPPRITEPDTAKSCWGAPSKANATSW